jgi:hypothetical protein
VQVTKVHSNHARAKEIERLELDEGDGEDETADEPEADEEDEDEGPRLGSRDNFWGK